MGRVARGLPKEYKRHSKRTRAMHALLVIAPRYPINTALLHAVIALRIYDDHKALELLCEAEKKYTRLIAQERQRAPAP